MAILRFCMFWDSQEKMLECHKIPSISELHENTGEKSENLNKKIAKKILELIINIGWV